MSLFLLLDEIESISKGKFFKLEGFKSLLLVVKIKYQKNKLLLKADTTISLCSDVLK